MTVNFCFSYIAIGVFLHLLMLILVCDFIFANRFSISSGVLVFELTGAVVGAVLGIVLLPNLLNVVLSNYGIVEMPLVINIFEVMLKVLTVKKE